MIRYFSADEVCLVSAPPMPNGVLGFDASNNLVEIWSASQAKEKQLPNIQYFEGVLVPGFVNTHCHLELSHLKDKIAQKTGIVGFVSEIMQSRQAGEVEIIAAMQAADALMFENGIIAVGDIANQSISKTIKSKSLIYYHTFVEIAGFNPAKAKEMMQQAQQVKQNFVPLLCSIVPHAPYSVSDALFEEIKSLADNAVLSIHNQESKAENDFFESKTGNFLSLYQRLGLNIDFFQPMAKSSLQSFLPKLAKTQNLLLVHNTFSHAEDIDFATAQHPHLYWCLCANANLYIENQLPDVNLLRQKEVKITLGTDSLASNTTLSVLAEMQTLKKHFQIPFEEILQWATLNGAQFLQIDKQVGSFEIGKKPGLNLLSNKNIDEQTILKRII
ncbi:MAG: amidohydrolase family protein [Sphingobacteriaceae bacterium]|nr:amidohydrolase family protein [Sphingobacteriaceae bacterium]